MWTKYLWLSLVVNFTFSHSNKGDFDRTVFETDDAYYPNLINNTDIKPSPDNATTHKGIPINYKKVGASASGHSHSKEVPQKFQSNKTLINREDKTKQTSKIRYPGISLGVGEKNSLPDGAQGNPLKKIDDNVLGKQQPVPTQQSLQWIPQYFPKTASNTPSNGDSSNIKQNNVDSSITTQSNDPKVESTNSLSTASVTSVQNNDNGLSYQSLLDKDASMFTQSNPWLSQGSSINSVSFFGDLPLTEGKEFSARGYSDNFESSNDLQNRQWLPQEATSANYGAGSVDGGSSLYGGTQPKDWSAPTNIADVSNSNFFQPLRTDYKSFYGDQPWDLHAFEGLHESSDVLRKTPKKEWLPSNIGFPGDNSWDASNTIGMGNVPTNGFPVTGGWQQAPSANGGNGGMENVGSMGATPMNEVLPPQTLPQPSQTLASPPKIQPAPKPVSTKAPKLKQSRIKPTAANTKDDKYIEPQIFANSNMSITDQIMLINIDPDLDFPATISTDDGELFELFEGDIIRTRKLEEEVSDMKIRKHYKRLHNSIETGQWLNGVIPYTFHEKFSKTGRKMVTKAMKVIEEATCLRFKQRTDNDPDYVEFIHGGACASMVGRQGGVQQLSLGRSCLMVGIILHELMHAIGFFHEQNRLDRDKYVKIDWNNVNRAMWYNFQHYRSSKSELDGPYAKSSIMHYGSYAFTMNGQKSMVSKSDSSELLGQRFGLGNVDIERINRHYHCNNEIVASDPYNAEYVKSDTVMPKGPKDKYIFCFKLEEFCNSERWVRKHCKKTCCKDHDSRLCKYWRKKRLLQQKKE